MNEKELLQELDALLCGHWMTDLANFAAFFYEKTQKINWIGFYLSDHKKLRLGPFNGKPACLEISFSRGVWGHSFEIQKSVVINDVNQFPDHISCDPASKAEMVIPLIIHNKIVGVLDIDSPVIGRFNSDDLIFFQKAVQILSKKIEMSNETQFGSLF